MNNKDQKIRLPNFLVVGAARSGTTAIYNFFKEHPMIYMPKIKSPAYFMTYPRAQRIDNFNDYIELFKEVRNEIAVGEVSVNYLIDKFAYKNILKKLGDIKIIIILRNPVTVAYSLWGHMCWVGGETLSFKEAIDIEDSRKTNIDFINNSIESAIHYFYVERGLYYNQVKRYLDTFSNVKIYIFEEFFKNPTYYIQDLYNFLEVDPSFLPKIKKYNASKVYNNRGIQLYFNSSKFLKLKNTAKQIIPEKFRHWLKLNIIKINSKEKPLPELDEETKKKLYNIFLPDIEKLEKLIKKDLSVWKK